MYKVSDTKRKIQMIREFERGYPERLRHYKGMPEQLYYIGNLPDGTPSAAIVGARACTEYGRTEALHLAEYLAGCGITIISGMAEGIDAAAHEGALRAGGRTYAVLGCGADICYPRSSRKIYDRIPENGGILTEYPPGTNPMAYRFPARNRIIAALADVLIVAEARRKSGSLITADQALEMGKPVLAVPGRREDPLSQGTNDLIAQGAGIITSYENVLSEFSSACAPRRTQKQETFAADLSAGAAKLLPHMTQEAVPADLLSSLSGLSEEEVRAAVTELLMEDLVREISPGLYVHS